MAYTRISARRSQEVNLNTSFYRGGQPADPFAIYKIEIYRGSVSDSNLVDTTYVVDPDNPAYPSPLSRYLEGSEEIAGRYAYVWDIPSDAVVPDVYFDVWYFWGNDPTSGTGTGGTDGYEAYTNSLLTQCNKFWVYPDQWYVDGGLQTLRFGFEPIDIKFNKPEKRPLEVGIMPLPLYDYNYNLVAPLIPHLQYTIDIETENCEAIVEDGDCSLKLRQGAYRSNPWLISYMLDTSLFFIGTYKYRITAHLPDGTTRTSGDFILTIS